MIVKALFNIFSTSKCEQYKQYFVVVFDYLFLAFVILLMGWCRWNSVVYPWPLNPDEAQAGANTLRILAYGLNWDSLDGTTVGPLNSLVLCWPYIFGLDVTLSTIRLTALILLSGVLVLNYFSIALMGGRMYAIAFTLPLLAFYSLATNVEFLHYSSELLSVLLVTLSIYVLLLCFYKINLAHPLFMLRLFCVGLILGSIPYAKIQATPIAVTISLFSILFIQLNKKFICYKISLITFLLSGLLVSIAFLVPLIVGGDFYDFWNSYIIWPTIYIKDPLTFQQFTSLVSGDPILVYITLIPFLVLGFVAVFQSGRFSRVFPKLWGLFFVAIVASAYLSITRPGNMFPHYLMLLPSFFLLASAFVLIQNEPKFFTKHIYAGAFAISIIFIFFPDFKKLENVIPKAEFKFNWSSPRIFDYLFAENDDKLLVWGWMPQWHITSGIVPATRESMNNNQIVHSKLQEYFKLRHLHDVKVSTPAYVIDAVAGNSFGFNDSSKFGLHNFPELANYIDANYNQISGVKINKKCPKVFVRNDRYLTIKDKIVDFASIKASGSWSADYAPENVDDYSVTEDACTDFWLLPNNQRGFLDFKFKKMDMVQEVLILNTGNSHFMNHGSVDITLQLFINNKIVYSVSTKLNHYPVWTKIMLKHPILANSMRLNVDSWRGNGGGVNEVKVVRHLK